MNYRQNRLKFLPLVLLAMLSSACADLPATPIPTLSPAPLTRLDCEWAAAQNPLAQCLMTSDDGVLLQAPSEGQITLVLERIQLSFGGTVYARAIPGERLAIAAIEGVAAIGLNGMTRVVQTGGQLSLTLNGAGFEEAAFAAGLEPFNPNLIPPVQLAALQRPVSLPAPIAASTPTPAQTAPQITPTGCPVRDDWPFLYTVQRGDTLSAIAARYQVTLETMTQANCLVNANRLQPGDVLRVPSEIGSVAGAEFAAEPDQLQRGECANLFWTVANAGAVYLDGEPVAHNEARQVCPASTTTYALLVVFSDGSQVGYTLTVTVQ